MKICILIALLWQPISILCLPGSWRQNAEFHGQFIFTRGDHASTVNEGDSVFIGYTEEDEICCRPDLTGLRNLMDYQVTWQNQHGDTIQSWSRERRVFSLGGKHIPHSYLVFTDFTQTQSGVYTCVLWYKEKKLAEAHVFVEDTFWEEVPSWLRIFF
ncbi:uncharacterized protein [Palaemon carinicauda]|uniref:uncharacterized protein n=1 Tax=Palaemon carinicauda TaxID=392227 RepID=UPI0035B5D12C